ncbi:surface lipoprotein assembly modifier [Roseivivax sp.]
MRAEAQASAATPARAPGQMEAEFQGALRAMAEGRPQSAARRLRALLAEDPSLVRVRLELARALFEAGRFGQARDEFRLVLSGGGLPDPVRARVLRYIREIDDRRGWRLDFTLGFEAPPGAGRAYDTDEIEVTFGGQTLVFEMDREAPPDTGLALEGGLRRQWALELAPGDAGAAAYAQIEGDLYQTEGETYDRESGDLALGLQFTWPQRTVFVEATAGRSWAAHDLSETRVGMRSGVSFQRASGLRTTLEAGLQEVRFGREGDQEATRGQIALEVARPLEGRAQLSLEGSYQRQNAEDPSQAYDFAELRLGYSKEFAGGWRVAPEVYLQGFRQEEPTAGLSERRIETEYGVEMRIEKTDVVLLGRFSPYVDLGAARRESSIEAYGYRDLSLGAGLTNAF